MIIYIDTAAYRNSCDFFEQLPGRFTVTVDWQDNDAIEVDDIEGADPESSRWLRWITEWSDIDVSDMFEVHGYRGIEQAVADVIANRAELAYETSKGG